MVNRYNVSFSILLVLLVSKIEAGSAAAAVSQKKVQPPKLKLNKWSKEEIQINLQSAKRTVVYYTQDEVAKNSEEYEHLENFQKLVNLKVKNINVGYHTCSTSGKPEKDQYFGCGNYEASQYPYLKLYETKRDPEFPIKDLGGLQQSLIKLENLVVPKVYKLNSNEELESFIESNNFALIANLDPKRRIETQFLKKIARIGRGQTPFWFNISRIENPEVFEYKTDQFKEEGIYMTAVVEGERVFVKYPYGVNGDDEEVSTVIEYFETQTLPLSFDFTKDNFGRIFTGSLNTHFIYFVDSYQSKLANKVRSELREAAKYNRREDLHSQRIIYMLIERNKFPEIQASFGEVKEGDMFITHVNRDLFLRFKYDQVEVDSSSIIDFVERFRNKAVEPFYISEPDHEEPVYFEGTQILQVTGRQYRKKIVSTQDTYFVLLCSNPVTCKQSVDTFKLLDSENTNRTALNLAYVNLEKNEIPGLSITKTPSFLLYIHPYKVKPKVFDLENKVSVISGWLNTYVPGVEYKIDSSIMFKHFYETNSIEERYKIKQFLTERNYTLDDINPEMLKKMVEDDKELAVYISQNNLNEDSDL